MAHVHTELNPELLRQLADDLEERPSEPCWETYYEDGPEWMACKPSHVLLNVSNGHKVRRKPATITRTVTVPKPMREEPRENQVVYCLNLFDGFFSDFEWRGDVAELSYLKNGLCFHTKEDAEAARAAILSLLRGDCDE